VVIGTGVPGWVRIRVPLANASKIGASGNPYLPVLPEQVVMPALQPPHIVTWNVTSRCPLHCPHCYLDAGEDGRRAEVGTAGAREILRQVAGAGTSILVLSGGEPLFRKDIFGIAAYGRDLGLRMALATSGVLITGSVASKIRSAGIKKVAVSLDSAEPARHDMFRVLEGAWERSVRSIGICRDYGIPVQLNVTMTPENRGEIADILRLAQGLGVRDIQLFFLVPAGRGVGLHDLSPQEYEAMIREALTISEREGISLRPTCAPQFMRIAREMGIHREGWYRGCIAGRRYLRICPDGEVTPCPYLPVSLGNVLSTPLSRIWEGSEVLRLLRDDEKLEGKCGICRYRGVCGGCRARAYGVTTGSPGGCSDLHPPGQLAGNLMAEEPMCPYNPMGA